MTSPDTALVDIDGTLVDTNYQHTLAWYRACRHRDIAVPITWDCVAARRISAPVIAILTGGFADGELRTAGAGWVFDWLDALRATLDETPLR